MKRLGDFAFVVIGWLAQLVLPLLLVGAPILFTAFYETATVNPPQPNHYCIGLVARDGESVWRGPLCFAADFGAQWYRNVVEFPATVSADCEVMSDEREKQTCEDRKKFVVDHVWSAIWAGSIGFALGSIRR